MNQKLEQLLTDVEDLLESDILRNHEVAEDGDPTTVELWKRIYDGIRTVRRENAKGTPAEKFYQDFENRFDYSMAILDRGLTLQYFIKENPRWEHLFKEPKPNCFSDLPLAMRYDYRNYILHELFDMGHIDSLNGYTEEDAIQDWYDTTVQNSREETEA
jgi:hypothetical protein